MTRRIAVLLRARFIRGADPDIDSARLTLLVSGRALAERAICVVS